VFRLAELEHGPGGTDCRDGHRLQVPLLEAERHLVLCRCQD